MSFLASKIPLLLKAVWCNAPPIRERYNSRTRSSQNKKAAASFLFPDFFWYSGDFAQLEKQIPIFLGDTFSACDKVTGGCPC